MVMTLSIAVMPVGRDHMINTGVISIYYDIDLVF